MSLLRLLTVGLIMGLSAGLGAAHAQDRGGRPGGGPGGPSGSLVGSVLDADTGEPVATASVAVWSAADSSLVTGAVTDTDGTFLIDGLRPGRYYARVSFIGYAPINVSDLAITPQNRRVDLGTVRIAPDAALMDEVEVTAEREFMEVRIDRTVYNTKDQIVADGGSATDLLRNIPSIEVDMDGQISLRGNQNVAVLINGRPSQMSGEILTSFLQGLPAGSIERVEVIPNPSARYEPDGMSGILNIVLKQDTAAGINGALTSGGSTQGEANASAMLGYRKGALSSRINYGFRRGIRERSGERLNEFRTRDPFAYLETLSEADNSSLSHTVNGNVDYRLGRQNTLSLSGLMSTRGSDGDDLNLYSEWLGQQAGGGLEYERVSLEDERDFNVDVGLAFARVIEPAEHELVIEARYEGEREVEDQEFRQEVVATGALMELERSGLEEGVSTSSLQLDYVRPLGGLFGDGKLEAGFKSTLQQLDSDIYSDIFDVERGVFERDASLGNTFVFDEQVHAAYGILGRQAGPLGLQAGVRLEQALTTFTLSATGDDYENNYFSVFPSAFATYKFSDAHQLRLAYSKRINRPRVSGWFNQLNPISDRSDRFFRRVGNPRLQPEYIHGAELTYTLTAGPGMLTLSPYYRRTVNVIRFINEVDAQGVTTLTFKNLDHSASWGSEAIATYRFGERVNGFASFDLYRVSTDASSVESSLSNDAYGWSTRLNATYKLTSTLDVQGSFFYRAPMDVEQGRIGAFTRSDLAFRQRLWGQKASLSLRIEDPLNMSEFNIYRDTPTFYLDYNGKWNARAASLTFTYNFGQQERDNRRRRGEGGPPGGGDMPVMM